MRSGRLRHRLILESPPDESRDAFGHRAYDGDWTTFAEVWGEVTPLSGREYWRAAQVQPDVTHQVTIRYLPNVTTQMRVRRRGETDRFYQIGAVLNIDERNREMQLMCRETVDGA